MDGGADDTHDKSIAKRSNMMAGRRGLTRPPELSRGWLIYSRADGLRSRRRDGQCRLMPPSYCKDEDMRKWPFIREVE